MGRFVVVVVVAVVFYSVFSSVMEHRLLGHSC